MTASQYISAQISIAVTSLACSSSSHHQPPPPLLNGLGLGLELKIELSKYQICCTVKTVKAFWCEWTVDLLGRPSIDMLDWQWGSRWRAGRHTEVQFYSLRLEIIKEIRHIAQAQRTSEEAAMWQVSKQQQNMGCSLDKRCKLLRAGRKARK